MIQNGTELQAMTHNDVEVQTWIHNGVEVFSASEPWVAYDVVQGSLVANSPASPPTSNGNIQAYPTQYMWIIPTTSTSQYMQTKNIDGTSYLPTQRCRYMDIIVRSPINAEGILIITGKTKDGSDIELLNYSIPKYSDNTNNTVDGVEYIKYVHLVSNINVKGYESISAITRPSTANANGAGIGLLRFHN